MIASALSACPGVHVAQQMSMLGNSGSSFNRPTSIELLVNPAYRIYYAGEEHVEDLLVLCVQNGRRTRHILDRRTHLRNRFCIKSMIVLNC